MQSESGPRFFLKVDVFINFANIVSFKNRFP